MIDDDSFSPIFSAATRAASKNEGASRKRKKNEGTTNQVSSINIFLFQKYSG